MVKRSLFFSELTTAYDDNLVATTVSISSGPDDGANNKLALYFKTNLRHGTTQLGITNILSIREAQTVILCGHGFAGLLDTGQGAFSSSDITKKLSETSRKNWENEVLRIYEARKKGSQISELEIISCDTGAEENGAYLLWLIAKIADLSQVRARTGITTLYSQGSRRWIEYEAGSSWQIATNGMYYPPVAIPVPGRPLTDRSSKDYFEIFKKGSVEKISFSTIEEIVVTNFSAGNSIEIRVSDNLNFLDELFDSEQMDFEGNVLAEITSKITLRTPEQNFEIDVYNSRFAVMPHFSTAFYIRKILLP